MDMEKVSMHSDSRPPVKLQEYAADLCLVEVFTTVAVDLEIKYIDRFSHARVYWNSRNILSVKMIPCVILFLDR